MINERKRFDRVRKKFILGNIYLVGYDPNNLSICKFIQPTKCGFNFLNIITNKCLLSNHLYPTKYIPYNDGNHYYVNKNLKTKELIK